MRVLYFSLLLTVFQVSLFAQALPPAAVDAKSVFEKKVAAIRSSGDEAAQATKFEEVRSMYEQALRGLMEDLVSADQIDDALAVRDLAREVVDLKIFDVPGAGEVVASVPPATGDRAGRLRGFGRKSGMRPWGAMFDLSSLQQHEDYVDIAGNLHWLTFLRKNGEVLDHEGNVIGTGAVKIFPSGYLDRGGVYHSLGGSVDPPEVPSVLITRSFKNRRLTVNRNGELFATGSDYEQGLRQVPERALKGVKQVGFNWDNDNVLTTGGHLIRWNKKGELNVPETIKSGVAKISLTRYNCAFVLTENNDLLGLNGKPNNQWPGKARDIQTGGLLWAVQDMESRWHVFFNKSAGPSGDEVAALETVLNRSETIDVQFYLRNQGRKDWSRTSYALWIEEVGAPEVKPADPEKAGDGFFGIPIE